MQRPEARRTYSRNRVDGLEDHTYRSSNNSVVSADVDRVHSTTMDQDIEEEKHLTMDQDIEEEKHFQQVVNAFKSYSFHLEQKVKKYKNNIASLPQHQQELIKSYRESLNDVEKCIKKNQEVINVIINNVESLFVNIKHKNDTEQQVPTPLDMDRVQVTLKQIVRDWSNEGKAERDACYQPIIEELDKKFPSGYREINNVKVLVPGAGLGRLAYEIASRGYTCQGNEFSLFMLIASNFVLNKINGSTKYTIHPWIHQVDNNMSPDHQMHPVSFPDVNPNVILRKMPTRFTMAAGDFLEIYTTAADWHCVATSFFIDCAHNIVDFIEKIYYILKPGGVWINLGPLMYHFSNMPREFSIQPPYSTIKEVIKGIGFYIEKEEVDLKTTYCQNTLSMQQYEYKSVFFVCRKPVQSQRI